MHEDVPLAATAAQVMVSRRMDAVERMLGRALDAAARPGSVFDGLIELAGALRSFRPRAESVQGIWDEAFAAGRRSVLDEQAAERNAPRPALQVIRLSGWPAPPGL